MSWLLAALTLAGAALTLTCGVALVTRGLCYCLAGHVLLGALLCMFGAVGVRDIAYGATARQFDDGGTVLVDLAPAHSDQEVPR